MKRKGAPRRRRAYCFLCCADWPCGSTGLLLVSTATAAIETYSRPSKERMEAVILLPVRAETDRCRKESVGRDGRLVFVCGAGNEVCTRIPAQKGMERDAFVNDLNRGGIRPVCFGHRISF